MEVNEQAYPLVFEAHAITENSAGAGQARGGFGTTMRIRVCSPVLRLSLIAERCRSAPFGLFGGRSPEPFANGLWNQLRFVLADGREGHAGELFGRVSPSKWGDIELHEGDVVEYVTTGGGGYGDVALRDPERTRADLVLGYIDPEHAARIYHHAGVEDGVPG
jgi:N-methylhydantoinase B/oxoprolinase/acetone carboxylase alpha subunit